MPWLSRRIVPLAREAGADALVSLRRGWLHGPHVDIVDGTGAVSGWSGLAARLDAGPVDPDSELSEQAYLDQAREFGRLESVPPPYLPMREHGSVEFLGPEDVGSAVPGLDRLEHVVRGVLNKPLMHTIDELADAPGNATLRLAEAFVALADTHHLGPGYGTFSLRSHAEAFLAWAAPSKDVREVFGSRLRRDAPILRTAVEQRVSGETSAPAAAWRTAFGYCSGALDSAVAHGTLTLDKVEAVADRAERTGPPGATETVPEGSSPDSAFHHAVTASGVIDDPSPWFASYRLLTNLFYQQLPLLTVSAMQRYYMCYAIAETVDEVLGESWQERLGARQARMSENGAA